MSAFVILASLFLLLISGESLGQVIRVSSRSEHVGGNQTKSSKMQTVELLMPERRDNERSGGNSLHLPNDRSENIEINVKLSQGGSQSNQGVEGDSQRIYIEQNSTGAANQLSNERNRDIRMILNQIRDKTNAQQRQIESQQILIESMSANHLPGSKTQLSQQNNDLKANLRSMQSQLESLQILLVGSPQQTMNSTSNQSEALDGRDERKKREFNRFHSTIPELQNQSQDNSSSSKISSDVEIVCPNAELANSVEFPPQCCSFPFTYEGRNHYQCIESYNGLFGCFIENRTWVACAEPTDFVARNKSLINVTIPAVARFTTTSVHGWIVFQQQTKIISKHFNRSWEEFKAGFGNPDGNFWMGLEKIHRITNSAPYKLRLEIMIANGSFFSAEYDSFHLENEAGQYKIHVGGYSGDAGDVMNRVDGGILHNGMNFSTYDRDNDNNPTRNMARSNSMGGWFNTSTGHTEKFGLHLDVPGSGCDAITRMMMKKL